jgi:hypothetical protein
MIQKETEKMLSTKRSSSTQRQRNPIMPNECDEEQARPHRGKVPDYLAMEKRLAVSPRQERPRGLAQGEFRAQGTGSFQLAYEQPISHRPHKKPIVVQDSPPHTLKSKKICGRPSTANPITQGDSHADDNRFESAPVRPREILNYRSSVFSSPAPWEEPEKKPSTS